MHEQLTKYLTDVHSIEVQALEQMRLAPRMAGEPRAGRDLPRAPARDRGARAARARGARAPRRRAVAGEGRRRPRRRLGDGRSSPASTRTRRASSRCTPTPTSTWSSPPTSFCAGSPSAPVREVAAMAARDRRRGARDGGPHRRRWDEAVDASLREKDADATREELVKYLRDAHALEAQAIQLLEAGPRDRRARGAGRGLPRAPRAVARAPAARRGAPAALDSRPARFQPAAMRVSALNLGGFFKAQPDSPVKLAGFAYAFEALETGAYELLARTARRAGDEETAAMAERDPGRGAARRPSASPAPGTRPSTRRCQPQRLVEEADHAALVLGGARRDPADVLGLRDLPQRLRLLGGADVAAVEPLAVGAVRRGDQQQRAGGMRPTRSRRLRGGSWLSNTLSAPTRSRSRSTPAAGRSWASPPASSPSRRGRRRPRRRPP